MKEYLRRLLAMCICVVLVLALCPAIAPTTQANAATYSGYTTIAKVPTQSPCSGMQGMDVDGTYIYCAKIDDDKTACIARVHKSTGALTWLTNSATGTKFFYNLFHANDLAVCTVNGVKTMFVGTGGAGKGEYGLVRLTFDGTTLKMAGHYNMKHSGSEKYIAGVKVVATSATEITLVLKSGNHVYTAKIPYSSTGGDIPMNYLGKLDFSAVSFNGTVKDISNYVVQGFGYKDNKLFVPMTANYQTSTSHISTIVCFDLDGIRGGNIKPDDGMSVWIADTTYPALFEIESCAISPTDGKLYFGTNCRKSSTDGNHDGVHVLNGFVYNPTMSDPATAYNYYFQTSSNKLQTVTTANSVFNSVLQHLGTVSGNKISGGQWSMDMPIILKHSDPWIITWEASNWTGNSLLLSTYDTSSYANNYYLYRRSGSGLVALGYYGNSQYNNYGVMLSEHGIDDTLTHKYQLKNQVNADGTNMVYLWVDGTNLGAMNNYYVGATSQKKTVNWVSGKDFTFSYIGTAQHTVSGTLKNLRVWTKGNINAYDEPSVFRWETQDNAIATVSQFGCNTNNLTVLGGSCSGGTCSDYYSRLTQPVVLMHNRPWIVEWKTPAWSGNTMLFSSGDTALKLNASYLYRSTEIVALGYSDGVTCHSYGINLTDHGLDPAGGYTYRLINRVEDDGTNMVYLSVNGKELGPMNRYYLGNTYQNATSDWVSGKDFTFLNMGNYHYGLQQSYEYIQVWENGMPQDDPSDCYRWEGSGSSFKNITTDGRTANTANRVTGSISNNVLSEASFRLDTPVVLRHDRTWSISWQSSGNWTGSAGGGFFFSASLTNGEQNAPYIYRRRDSEMIGFGFYNGSRHVQYGITLSDHGIDGTASHCYTLTNKVDTDGTNMVYLSVDGKELGAMNHYYVGGSPEGTTSNWISGKDFTFTYMGTPRFPLSNVTINYLEVDEGAHEHNNGPWTVTQAATCTADGIQTRTCAVCGVSETQKIPAAGHDYSSVVTAPTCVDQGFTTRTCKVCGYSYQDEMTDATGHHYSGGSCTVCAAADPNHTPTVTQPVLTLKSPALEFKDMITVNAFYTAENIQDVVEMGMITYSSQVASWSVDTAEHMIPGATYVESSGRYYSSSQGIHGKYLGNTVYLAIYAKLTDGSYAYSKLVSYSAVQYATGQLKNSTDIKLKQLVVAMLNYGAEAQRHFGHNTDCLANAVLSAEQKSLPAAYDSGMVGSVPAASAAKQGSLANNGGFASRKPAVSFEGAFCINYFFTPNYTPDQGITLYYWNAADYNAASVLTTANATGSIKMTAEDDGQYRGDIQGIAAKGISDAVYIAAVYQSGGTVWTSGVLGYSIGAYCSGQATKGGTIADLAMATAVYGYHAKQYFG